MAPVTTPPLPGSMTVPVLFGWEELAAVLTLLVVLAVLFVAIRATRADRTERSEWEAWLESRPPRRRDPD